MVLYLVVGSDGSKATLKAKTDCSDSDKMKEYLAKKGLVCFRRFEWENFMKSLESDSRPNYLTFNSNTLTYSVMRILVLDCKVEIDDNKLIQELQCWLLPKHKFPSIGQYCPFGTQKLSSLTISLTEDTTLPILPFRLIEGSKEDELLILGLFGQTPLIMSSSQILILHSLTKPSTLTKKVNNLLSTLGANKFGFKIINLQKNELNDFLRTETPVQALSNAQGLKVYVGNFTDVEYESATFKKRRGVVVYMQSDPWMLNRYWNSLNLINWSNRTLLLLKTPHPGPSAERCQLLKMVHPAIEHILPGSLSLLANMWAVNIDVKDITSSYSAHKTSQNKLSNAPKPSTSHILELDPSSANKKQQAQQSLPVQEVEEDVIVRVKIEPLAKQTTPPVKRTAVKSITHKPKTSGLISLMTPAREFKDPPKKMMIVESKELELPTEETQYAIPDDNVIDLISSRHSESNHLPMDSGKKHRVDLIECSDDDRMIQPEEPEGSYDSNNSEQQPEEGQYLEPEIDENTYQEHEIGTAEITKKTKNSLSPDYKSRDKNTPSAYHDAQTISSSQPNSTAQKQKRPSKKPLSTSNGKAKKKDPKITTPFKEDKKPVSPPPAKRNSSKKKQASSTSRRQSKR